MLIGEYKHTIDNKKRLAIPAKLRKEISRGAVLTRGLDNCLALYPLAEWGKLAEKLSKMTLEEQKEYLRKIRQGEIKLTN